MPVLLSLLHLCTSQDLADSQALAYNSVNAVNTPHLEGGMVLEHFPVSKLICLGIPICSAYAYDPGVLFTLTRMWHFFQSLKQSSGSEFISSRQHSAKNSGYVISGAGLVQLADILPV